MALRFDHQVAAVGGWAVECMNVSRIDEIVFVQHTALRRVTQTVLRADEAVRPFFAGHTYILAFGKPQETEMYVPEHFG